MSDRILLYHQSKLSAVVLRRLNVRSYAFATFSVRLAAAICCTFLYPPSLHADQSNVRSEQVTPRKEPNSRIVVDQKGQQLAEIRWNPGRAGPIGTLRIPVGYLWRGVGMLNATFGPDYPDPNVVQSFRQTFILEALLPSFEPMTPQNATLFKDGFTGETIRISITVAPFTTRDGRPTIDANFWGRLESERPRSTNGLLFKAPFEQKPDRFDLRRMGPVSSNFGQFKSFGFVNDTYFPAYDPKDVYLVCGAEEIRDVLEDPSWPRRPICEHHFYSETLGAIIELTYRRIRLKDWRAIQAGAEQLFKSFEFLKPIGGFDGRSQQ
jgi:hypothetical protein